MTTILPPVLQDYFHAEDRRDSAALAACFATDGIVFDEGGTHRGHADIAAWHAAAAATYAMTTVPTGIETSGDQTTVHAQVSGNFPGSPLNMAFAFTLAGAHIAALKITA